MTTEAPCRESFCSIKVEQIKLLFRIEPKLSLCYPRSMKLFGIVVSLLLITPSSFAVSKRILETLPVYSLCKNRKIVRMIRVIQGNNSNCLTVYSKGGAEKIAGDATNDLSCFKFYENIKTNLGNAGWTCKELEKETVVIAQ